jgi:hypothetical protein
MFSLFISCPTFNIDVEVKSVNINILSSWVDFSAGIINTYEWNIYDMTYCTGLYFMLLINHVKWKLSVSQGERGGGRYWGPNSSQPYRLGYCYRLLLSLCGTCELRIDGRTIDPAPPFRPITLQFPNCGTDWPPPLCLFIYFELESI